MISREGSEETRENRGEQELAKAQRKLEAATGEAISAARSLEREMQLQTAATEQLRISLEGRQRQASESLAKASNLMSALKTPGALWGEVVRDIGQLGDGRAHDDLVRALQESAAICESFIGQEGDEQLVQRIDEVIHLLAGDKG